jgi:ATP adenylyltransferase
MKRLYAPWRASYNKSTEKFKKEDADKQDCVFCKRLAEQEDEKNFIIARFKHHTLMMNLYPYNDGHMLILHNDHKQNLEDLSPDAQAELMSLIARCTAILKKELSAQGVNVGINLGKAAGASIPSHLHIHVLPRWFGDTNFLPTLSETKQISVAIKNTYKILNKGFKN